MVMVHLTNESGEWGFLGTRLTYGNRVDPRLLELRNRYAQKNGYELRVLEGLVLGDYVVVERNGEEKFISPIVVYAGSGFDDPDETQQLEVLDAKVAKLRISEFAGRVHRTKLRRSQE